jgi:N-acetylneuraminate synthase/N,N'-diacetyllegionaminate synthase
MKQHDVLLGGKLIGASSKIFVIAEIGINHDGSVDRALKLIDAAAESGADAVKFQTFRADRLMVPASGKFAQQGEGEESAYEMFRRLELSWQDHRTLKSHADRRGVLFLSTPFDEESADFLDDLGVPAFKIASSDITHLPLLRHLAQKKKPLLLSTGMSHMSEVEEAVNTMESWGARDIVLLHCVSSYPASPDSLNLKAIQSLRERFGMPVGFSDHSEGILCALVAAALGAKVLEKHFTLDRNARGPDHKLSMEPEELCELVRQLAVVEASLGNGCKHPTRKEEQTRLASRRSVVAAVDIPMHETIQPWMVTCKRPGGGIDPREIDLVTGSQARRRLAKDSILGWSDLLMPDRHEAGSVQRTHSATACS